MSEESKTAPKKKTTSRKKVARLKRDADGLIEGVDYKFDETGFVDWRAMISPTQVYPNKEWFAKRDQPVPDETPEELAKLADNQLLVRLGGLKQLLKLRGFTNVSGYTDRMAEDYVTASVTIVFAPNFETDGKEVSYTETANATCDNVDDFGLRYLETFAYNRAFARCIRNFLNIDICSDEEIGKTNKGKAQSDNNAAATSGFSPQDSLQNKASERGLQDWNAFVVYLRKLWDDGSYKNDAAAGWKKFKDIPSKDARTLIALLPKDS